MKSSFLASLPDDLVHEWVDQLSHVPDGAEGGFSVWAWGHAIAEVPEEDTAFTGRRAAFWAGAEIAWHDEAIDDACRSWARVAADSSGPYASVGRYVERLVALKREWDPDNVFRLNQNIRP